MKEEKSLSAQKGGKGIPGMPGRGNFISKSLEAVKFWVGGGAGFIMCLKCQVRGERSQREGTRGCLPYNLELICGFMVLTQ